VLPEVSFSPLEPEPVLAEAGEGAAVTKEMPLADISMESYEAASTEGAAASDSVAHLKLGQVTGNTVRLRTGPDSSYSILQ
jgi:hypothetical protein